jgi:hypothetical protein
VKLGQAWYFMSFTGLSSAGIDGLADTVNKGTVAFGLLSDAELVRKSGVKQFDNGVINAILAEQTANQSIMNGILDRSLTVIELGTPAPGAGTTVVPANLSGKSAKPVAGEAVMVNATVGQDDLVFLTSFRTK